jgi:hypothetical protein
MRPAKLTQKQSKDLFCNEMLYQLNLLEAEAAAQLKMSFMYGCVVGVVTCEIIMFIIWAILAW